MKKQIGVFGTLFISLVLIFNPSIGRADPTTNWVLATTQVNLDWSTLGIALDPGMNLTWLSQTDEVGAFNSFFYGTVSPWGTVEAGIQGQATGVGSTSDTDVTATTGAGPSTAFGPTYVSANAFADRWGIFDITGAGYVTFSIESEINITQIVNGGFAANYGYASVTLDNLMTLDEDEDEYWGSAFLYSVEGDVIQYNDSSGDPHLSVSLYFDDGDQGYFGPYAYSYTEAAVVPAPSALLLVSSGLASLVGFGRKRLFGKA